MENLCGFCKYYKYNEDAPYAGYCSSKKKDIEVAELPCSKFENSIRNCFYYHYFFLWDDNTVYFTTDFEDELGITRHLSRYYLLSILTYREHKIFRVMISNKGYYIKRNTIHYSNMQKFARDNLCDISF